jgi:hypothetical protein
MTLPFNSALLAQQCCNIQQLRLLTQWGTAEHQGLRLHTVYEKVCATQLDHDQTAVSLRDHRSEPDHSFSSPP